MFGRNKALGSQRTQPGYYPLTRKGPRLKTETRRWHYLATVHCDSSRDRPKLEFHVPCLERSVVLLHPLGDSKKGPEPSSCLTTARAWMQRNAVTNRASPNDPAVFRGNIGRRARGYVFGGERSFLPPLNGQTSRYQMLESGVCIKNGLGVLTTQCILY